MLVEHADFCLFLYFFSHIFAGDCFVVAYVSNKIYKRITLNEINALNIQEGMHADVEDSRKMHSDPPVGQL